MPGFCTVVLPEYRDSKKAEGSEKREFFLLLFLYTRLARSLEHKSGMKKRKRGWEYPRFPACRTSRCVTNPRPYELGTTFVRLGAAHPTALFEFDDGERLEYLLEHMKSLANDEGAIVHPGMPDGREIRGFLHDLRFLCCAEDHQLSGGKTMATALSFFYTQIVTSTLFKGINSGCKEEGDLTFKD
ncbi:hypothetical protein SELMODRAFT_410121 [Selaginella moellendorffii]|uniref:Uncharacterized protein n=1 Tax=Selaginella moellendorffii TaxID=88036 RepID=D8RDP8_SELML|nr:hypothetical protein SELMODRAFT_410121 [Selaginella moellendorffii]